MAADQNHRELWKSEKDEEQAEEVDDMATAEARRGTGWPMEERSVYSCTLTALSRVSSLGSQCSTLY